MKYVNISTFLNIDLSFEIATPGKRFGAFVVDWLIKWGYIIVMSRISGIALLSNAILLSLIIYAPYIFYTFLLEWLNKGQTIGKMLFKIKVIGKEGNPPTLSQCAIRWMFLFVDGYLLFLYTFVNPVVSAFAIFSPLLGFIMILVTPYNQRIGDYAAQTYIVNTKERVYSLDDTIYAYAMRTKNDYDIEFPEIVRLSDRDMTIVKNLLEKSRDYYDEALAHKLASHIKTLLNITTQKNDFAFLTKILEDYNHLSIKQN